MGGIRVDKYYFGYAFDYTFNAIGARTLGSHEIMAAIKFGDNAQKVQVAEQVLMNLQFFNLSPAAQSASPRHFH